MTCNFFLSSDIRGHPFLRIIFPTGNERTEGADRLDIIISSTYDGLSLTC